MRAKDEHLSSEGLFIVLETLHTFIYRRADLDDMAIFFFDLITCIPAGRKESVWVQPSKLVQVRWRHASLVLKDGMDSVIYVSVPAHSVLDALQKYAPLDEEIRFREMLSFLDNKCLNWNSSERCRAFDRICRGEDTAEEPQWFEAI